MKNQHIIKTERLVLRPLTLDDMPTVHEYASDLDTTKYMIYLPNKTLDKTTSFVHLAILELEKDYPLYYEFAVTTCGSHIGTVSVYLDEQRREGEFGWVLNKKYCGKGYATEAVLALKDFAINYLKLEKIVARCDSRNIPSQRVMQKMGLKLQTTNSVRIYPDERGEAKEHMYSLHIN